MLKNIFEFIFYEKLDNEILPYYINVFYSITTKKFYNFCCFHLTTKTTIWALTMSMFENTDRKAFKMMGRHLTAGKAANNSNVGFCKYPRMTNLSKHRVNIFKTFSLYWLDISA